MIWDGITMTDRTPSILCKEGSPRSTTGTTFVLFFRATITVLTVH